MISLFFKEINSFFSSLIGYITIGLFLLITGLFMWIFPDTSLLSYEYATLDYFFNTAPWILMFLVPAVTMRSFSEELNSGTIELLATKPLTDLQIVLGKFGASFVLVILAIIPTLVYYYSVYQLGAEIGNIDIGATNGSYIGLILLGGTFVSIGLFTSSLTSSQIVSFLVAVFLCFFFYMAFDFLSRLDLFFAKIDGIIENIGIYAHYSSISRGVLDTRDLVYFITLTAFFLLLTKVSLESRKW